MVRCLFLFLPCLPLANSLGACPVLSMIYDSGQTHSLVPLLAPLLSEELPASVSVDAFLDTVKSSTQIAGPTRVASLLPIHSPGLSPGKLDYGQSNADLLQHLTQANPRPFFLIGSDPFSLQWLATHRDTLEELGAMGLLVQAETMDELRRVVAVAKGLPLTPAAGNGLATALGIDRYPVLITDKGLMQ